MEIEIESLGDFEKPLMAFDLWTKFEQFPATAQSDKWPKINLSPALGI